MRVLFVSPFLPYPPIAGGHAQVWSWIRRLSRSHETAFVGCYEREAEAEGIGELARHCALVRAQLRRPTPHAYQSFAQLPQWVTEFFFVELARELARVARGFRPEVVQFLATNMAQYERVLPRGARVVTALDIVSVAYRRRITAVQGVGRLQARLDWLRMLRYETRVFRRAHHVIAVSAHDARIIQALAPRARVTPVPPGVEPDQLAPRRRAPVAGHVLFVGYMEHRPNLDALLHLYQDIWPRVRRACPEARLTVAGHGTREELARAAPRALAAMEQDSSVELAGFVPDLPGLMDRTAALAAPLRLGAGVRNKVVEAMAAGLPVVTTSRGAEGLTVGHERELLIADEPEGFARQLVRLLQDEALQRRLSAAGRTLVAQEHDNERLARRLERALMEAAGAAA